MFPEVDVKNEPHEEDFEMLPTYADARPGKNSYNSAYSRIKDTFLNGADPYDAPIKSQLHKKVEDDEAAEYVATEYDAEEANYAVHSDGMIYKDHPIDLNTRTYLDNIYRYRDRQCIVDKQQTGHENSDHRNCSSFRIESRAQRGSWS